MSLTSRNVPFQTVSPNRALIVVIMLGSILVLSSCSRVEFLYHRMDWLIPHFIDDYVDLNEAQEKQLAQIVETFIHWHCSTQLPNYVATLKQWQRLADSGHLDSAQYMAQSRQVMDYFHQLAQASADAMKPLAHGLDGAQISHFIDKIKELNQTFKEDFVEQDIDKAKAKIESRLIERYERWVGSLNDKQLQQIKLASGKLLTFEIARYHYRQRWLQLFQNEWREHKSMDSVTDFLYYTVTDRERFWSTEYRLKYFDRNQENQRLTLYIMNSLNAKQLNTLKKELAGLESQLQNLVCR